MGLKTKQKAEYLSETLAGCILISAFASSAARAFLSPPFPSFFKGLTHFITETLDIDWFRALVEPWWHRLSWGSG